MAELNLDLIPQESSAEYKEVQSQMINFLEFWQRRGPQKSYDLIKAEYDVKKNFEEISPEAQREILQKFEELSNQPCDFLSIVEALDNITRR